MPCQCTHDHKDPLKRLEICSRVVGYLRPTSEWNKAKQAGFRNRKTYKINGAVFEWKMK